MLRYLLLHHFCLMTIVALSAPLLMLEAFLLTFRLSIFTLSIYLLVLWTSVMTIYICALFPVEIVAHFSHLFSYYLGANLLN